MTSNIVRFDPVRSIPATGIGAVTASYQTFGLPFAHSMRVVHIINNTDGDMMISFDDINDNIPVPAGSFSLYDLTSDQDTNESFRYINGSQLYIKYLTAPTKGTVYMVCIYGKGE